jgi:hypothetical protein
MDKKRILGSAKPTMNNAVPEKKQKVVTISNSHITKLQPPRENGEEGFLYFLPLAHLMKLVPKDPTHRVHRSQPVVGRKNMQVPKLVDLATQTIVENLDGTTIISVKSHIFLSSQRSWRCT